MTTPIRRFRPGDEPALYEICVRTGANGDDATDLYDEPDLPGHVYVGPYLRFEPDFALVLEDSHGAAGYVLGAPDTGAFEAECERQWWPPLRRRHPLESYHDTDRDARLVRLLHTPPVPPEDLVAAFPAHLHIDLLPRAQGQGHGRRLLTALFDRLSAAGVTGVHLGVAATNHRAVAFYRRMGFAEAVRDPDGLLMIRPL